ncbi:MAG: hypothetical protein JETT_2608 [Candidatus Jettenia ecosi]|uniref:Uncharacterized protein n=1 Tax=Candidatus Jettenia ecosi TaxID=2494326 RepID=A0A533Q8Y8_9BACT|nr:MAG: hypothetical protein JETT_2608 [Candidatus Jettenia ecosi]
MKKNEEIKDIAMELQLKEKTMTDILDRLSWKDQEIGRLTDELRNSKTIIASLSKDIERLRETDLLEHLSVKDQEIGRLSDDLHTATTTIESLKNNIEKLQKVDLLERLSVKDQEIGKLTDELHTTQSTITNLKTDIGKLCEIDVQLEEKKEEVGDKIEEGISADPLHATSKASLEIIENKKLE